jgi:hypothetical protein
MVVREILLEGRRLFAIYCDNDKRPMGWGHGWADAVADPAAMMRLRWHFNIGVRTGAINGIVVVDIDPRHGGDKTFAEQLAWLPETRRHRSRSGGWHLIYRYPEAGIPNFTGTDSNGLPGIELKSDGYGVVWTPSPGYSVIDDRPVAECPTRLIALVASLNTAPRPSGEKKDGPPMYQPPKAGVFRELPKDLYFRVRKLIPLSETVERHHWRRVDGMLRCVVFGDEGNQNAVLHWAAYWMAHDLIPKGILSRENAEELLTMAARGYAARDGMRAAWGTIQSGLRAGLRDAAPEAFVGHPSPLLGEEEDAQ